MEPRHPHEHTSHALRDVIEALPRYSPFRPVEGRVATMEEHPYGDYLSLADVRAVVHKAATLGAPVSHEGS